MHVEGTDEFVFVIHHEQAVDVMGLHLVDRFHGEAVGGDGLGVAHHESGDARGMHVEGVFQGAAQVAIGEDAGDPSRGVHHCGHAQALLAHFQQCLLERGVYVHPRQGVAGVHDVAHVHQQAAAQAAAGMSTGEVVCGKAARIQQRDRQGVAQGQRRRGAGGRREVEWAGLLVDRGVQVHVGLARQGGGGVAGHGDELGAAPLDERQDGGQLGRFARIGQGQHHVVMGDHAQVAMARLGRVDEVGRGAGGGQCGGNLAPDMAGFSHAGDHHAAAACQDQPHGRGEVFIQSLGHRVHRSCFDMEHLTGERKKVGSLGNGVHFFVSILATVLPRFGWDMVAASVDEARAPDA